MSTFVLSRQQRFRLRKELPFLGKPSLLGSPYCPPELQVGDSVNYVPVGTTNVYPFPTSLTSINKNGTALVSGTSPSYTLQSADAGGVITVVQNPSNSYGFDLQTSATVTVLPVQTAFNQNNYGGNVGSPAVYSANIFLTNGALGCAGIVNYGANFGSGYSGTFDSNGWPQGSFRMFVSLPSDVTLDGQLAHSVDGSGNPLLAGNRTTGPLKAYRCTYVSSTPQTSADVVVTGGSVANWQALGGFNYYFELTVPLGTNIIIDFGTAVQLVDIPRDGVTPSSALGEFYPPNLANAAQFASNRGMDLCNTNLALTETGWNTRNGINSSGNDRGPTSPTFPYSWERICRYFNGVFSYSGSALKKVWLNLPIRCTDDYINQCVSTINANLNPGIALNLEWGNENWNNIGGNLPQSYCFDQAYAECWLLQNYAVDSTFPVSIASVTASAGVATVTLNKNINQYFKQDGVTPFITNGASCFAVNIGSAPWSGSSTPGTDVPLTVPQQIVTVTTGGALAANQFSYPCGSASGTMGATQMAFFFNTTSTLVTDQTTWNLSNFWAKWQTRRTQQVKTLWSAVRPQDTWTLGLQQPGNLGVGSNANFAPPHLAYGNYLGGAAAGTFTGLSTFIDSLCMAPYVYPQTSLASCTSGQNVVHGVPFAAPAVAGDTVLVSNGSTSYGMTVVSGTGTDLTIAETLPFSGTNSIIVRYGPIAQVTASISGNTLTVTGVNTGIVARGPVNFPGVIPGTAISAQGTGTGTTGTYTLNTTYGTPVSSTTMTIGQADTAATLWAMKLGGVPEAAIYTRTLNYFSIKYGVKTSAYEGGPDISKNLLQMKELATYGQNNVPPNPAITLGVVLKAIQDAWFTNGGGLYHHFIIGPQQILDTGNASLLSPAYAAMQTFADTTAPKLTALLAYKTQQLSYTSSGGNGVATTMLAINNVYNPTGSVQTTGNNVGSVWWPSSAVGTLRQLDTQQAINRSGRYKLTVTGSDTVACPVDIFVDNATMKLGTVVLPTNGAGSSSATTPELQTSAALLIPFLSHGGHVFSARVQAGNGSSPCIHDIKLDVY